jgi:hypothetical protein
LIGSCGEQDGNKEFDMRKQVREINRRPSKLESLNDAEIQARWRSLKPKAIKGAAFFLVVAIVLFVGNHYLAPPQIAVNFINVGFQVCCVFAVCGAFLVVMSQMYGGSKKAKTPGES